MRTCILLRPMLCLERNITTEYLEFIRFLSQIFELEFNLNSLRDLATELIKKNLSSFYFSCGAFFAQFVLG